MATTCWRNQVDQINIFTFMDDLVVDVTEKMWILFLYRCKKSFIKVNKKKFELCKRPYMLGRNRENSIHLSSPIWDTTTQHNGFLAPHAEVQCDLEHKHDVYQKKPAHWRICNNLFAVLNLMTIIWPLMTFIDVHTSRILSITIASKLGMLQEFTSNQIGVEMTNL